MDSLIRDYLSTLTFRELQTFKNMEILPLFSTMSNGPEYVTLKDTLAQKFITITEIDQAGRVPELKVVNSSEYFVLLLDGEELIGARQNRVLTTSILLKPNSETILPVSCTEQGRWGYSSQVFSHSDIMMSQLSRFMQTQSVSASLHEGRGYTSDQGRVWDDIIRMRARVGVSSRTGAMRDVYSAKTDELNEYVQAFPYVPHQRGCQVFIDGEVTGFDMISRETAYKTVHSLFVKGYADDAIVSFARLDVTVMPGPVSLPITLPTEAYLTLGLTPRHGLISNDAVRIEGLPSINTPAIQDLKVNETKFVKVDLLDFYDFQDIWNILMANNGRIPMHYADDAIVSLAHLQLNIIPEPGTFILLGIGSITLMALKRRILKR